MKSLRRLLAALAFMLPTTPAIVAAAEKELKEPRRLRPFKPAWFEDAKFGIFMHWGFYSVPACRRFAGSARWR